MEAIILCAGEGTRLRPLSNHLPKPLFPVVCEPLLSSILDNLARHGIFRAVANVWYRKEDFLEFAQEHSGGEVLLSLVPEEKLLGTGGGIANVADHIKPKGTFLVHTGDIFSIIDLTSAIREHRASDARLTFLVRKGAREIFTREGAVVDINSQIGAESDSAWKFTGISIWEPEILEFMPRPGTPGGAVEGWISAIREFPGQIRFHDIGDALWSDIGTPWDYLELHRKLLDGDNFVAKRVDYAHGVRMRGNVCICGGARIASGCSLRDTVIWPGCEIGPGTILDSAIVGPFGIHRV